MRVSQEPSHEVSDPACAHTSKHARACSGTWRRRRARACTDPLTGGASHPKTERPSADAEESTAEPMWATCPARACVRLCARCCQAATCRAYTLKEAHAARRRHVHWVFMPLRLHPSQRSEQRIRNHSSGSRVWGSPGHDGPFPKARARPPWHNGQGTPARAIQSMKLLLQQNSQFTLSYE